MKAHAAGYIRIVARPVGEAPEWVRDAWIGVQLPLAAERMITTQIVGVVSGPASVIGQLWALATRKTLRMIGFCVLARAAVDELEKNDPAAAVWWKDNTPYLIKRRRYFLFDEASAERVLPA